MQPQRCKVSLVKPEELGCKPIESGTNQTSQVQLFELRSEKVPAECPPVIVQPERPDERLIVQRVRGRVALLCKGYASPPARAYWVLPDGQPQFPHETFNSTSYHYSSSSSSVTTQEIGTTETTATSVHAWLRIAYLSPAHEGTYTCVVNSTLGAVSRRVRLLVELLRVRLQVEQLSSNHVTVSWQLISELHARNSTDNRMEANLHRLDSRPLQYEVLYKIDDQPTEQEGQTEKEDTSSQMGSSARKRLLSKYSTAKNSSKNSANKHEQDTKNYKPRHTSSFLGNQLPRSWSGFEIVQISQHLHSFTVAGLKPLQRYQLCVGVQEQPLTGWEHGSMADQPSLEAEEPLLTDKTMFAELSNDIDEAIQIDGFEKPMHKKPVHKNRLFGGQGNREILKYVSEMGVERHHHHGQTRHQRSITDSMTGQGVTSNGYLSVSCARVSTSQPGSSSSLLAPLNGQLLPVAISGLEGSSVNGLSGRVSEINVHSTFGVDWWARLTGNKTASEILSRLNHLLSNLVKLEAAIMVSLLLLGLLISVCWTIRLRRQRSTFETPRKTLLTHMQHNQQPQTPIHNVERSTTPQIQMDNILSPMLNSRHT